jgi:hypothetical protein
MLRDTNKETLKQQLEGQEVEANHQACTNSSKFKPTNNRIKITIRVVSRTQPKTKLENHLTSTNSAGKTKTL